MKTITISDDTAEFLKSFVSRLQTQDCRGTADPYYFVVRGVRELSARDGLNNRWRYYYDGEVFTEDGLKAHCKENELIFDLVMGEIEDNDDVFDTQEVDEYTNVFFTFDGYKKHMEMNAHNYRHYEKVDSYVMHAYRNPEIAGLLNAVKEIGNELFKQNHPI